jgi:SAM-dependent methyltransferase
MEGLHDANYNGDLWFELPAPVDDWVKLPGQQTDSRPLTPVQLLPASIFELTEVRNLLAQEWALVSSSSLSVADGPMLSIAPEAIVGARERSLPRHSQLTRVHPRGSELVGDLVCSANALPFESESLQLIIARHVFDFSGLDSDLCDELARVLAPGGLLVVFGFNPVSSWRLWWLRQALRGLPIPDWCGGDQVRRRLSTKGCLSGRCEYLGGTWPSASASIGQAQGSRWHGAWSLTARKERAASRPVHLRARRSRVALSPDLAQSPARRIGI